MPNAIGRACAITLLIGMATGADAADLVLVNPGTPLVIPLVNGSTFSVQDGFGATQNFDTAQIASIQVQCRFGSTAGCAVSSMGDTAVGAGVAFTNTSGRTVLFSDGSMTIHRIAQPAVSIAQPRHATAQCQLGAGDCAGLPASAPNLPVVSMTATGFGGTGSGTNSYPVNTAFVLAISALNAEYCRRSATPLVPSWSGYTFPPIASHGLTLPSSPGFYQFSLTCFNAAGSSSATVSITATPPTGPGPDPCDAPPGFARQLTPATHEQLFGSSFPASGNGQVALAPMQYTALAFFVPPGTTGIGTFGAITPATGNYAALTLSSCPGSFAFANLAPGCRQAAPGRAVLWRVGAGVADACELTPGQTYYLNAAFVNGALQSTCASASCGAALTHSRSVVITDPIPTFTASGGALAPAVSGAPRLGAASALGGNIAVIGLPEADQGAGRAFVYRRQLDASWLFEAELNMSGKALGDKFGSSAAVSSDGRTIIVGAPGDDQPGAADQGSARIFRMNGVDWTQTPNETTLIASDGLAGDGYGSAVDVSPDAVAFLIGAPLRANTAGGAYFTKLPPGSKAANDTLTTAPIPFAAKAKAGSEIGDKFGSSVSTGSGANGGRWAIGAPGANQLRGLVRLLRDSGGAGFDYNQDVQAIAAAPGDAFGSAVDIDRGTVVVGAPGHDQARGSVTVIEAAATPAQVVSPPLLLAAPSPGDGLGSAVAIRGIAIVAGAPRRAATDIAGLPLADRGAVALFRRCLDAGCAEALRKGNTGWSHVHTVFDNNGLAGDRFGAVVGLTGEALVVGAPQREGGVGAAYLSRPVTSDDEVLRDGFESD